MCVHRLREVSGVVEVARLQEFVEGNLTIEIRTVSEMKSASAVLLLAVQGELTAYSEPRGSLHSIATP